MGLLRVVLVTALVAEVNRLVRRFLQLDLRVEQRVARLGRGGVYEIALGVRLLLGGVAQFVDRVDLVFRFHPRKSVAPNAAAWKTAPKATVRNAEAGLGLRSDKAGQTIEIVVNARVREQKRNRWQVALPRTRPAACFARHLLLDWVSRWLSHGTLADVEYAVGEALANSTEHGGGSIMTLSCWHDGEKVVVEVADRGGGFETALAGTNHRSQRGFGLFLMHELSDGVELFDGGRRVRLHKRLQEDDRIFRDNVRRQLKRRALREFTQAVPLVRFVRSALGR